MRRMAAETITGTIEENLAMAMQQDEIMRQCGPLDPYYHIAKMNVEYYLNCAAALEKGERELLVKGEWL